MSSSWAFRKHKAGTSICVGTLKVGIQPQILGKEQPMKWQEGQVLSLVMSLSALDALGKSLELEIM